MAEYFEITDAYSAAEYFTDLSKHKKADSAFRVIKATKGHHIISNVPEKIYNHSKLKKYIPPKSKNSGNDDHFINCLHQAFNLIHHNHPEAHLRWDDGKTFHYNNCHSNSIGGYFVLKSIVANSKLPINSPICISIGYISNSVSIGSQIGNAVVKTKGLFVHDWHIWNMVNDILVDLSMPKNGGIYEPFTEFREWQRAEDHVFRYPPNNISYNGINFSDHKKFAMFTKDIFADL